MGKSDTTAKNWFRNKERFADLFNGTLFRGEQLIKPEDLEIIDGEADTFLEDQNKKTKSVQRYRDIVMRWKNDVKFVILACENQDKIHYAMPLRNMLYDAMSYQEQMKRLWETQGSKGTVGEEFLSRFRKEDSLAPIVTLVFYYGEKDWDGSLELYDMINKDIPKPLWEKIKDYIPNYHINLVDPKNIEDFEKFQTDLQPIFGMLQYRNNKEAMVRYVEEHKDFFGSVDIDTYYAIREFIHSDGILNDVINESKEESVNMCKALQDLFDEGVEQGRREAEQRCVEVEQRRKEEEEKRKVVEEINARLEEENRRLKKLLEERE